MPQLTSPPAQIVADTIIRTVELGVRITDASVDGETTVLWCDQLTDGPGVCPGCGLDGVYRDSVELRVSDFPVVGHPLQLRVRAARDNIETTVAQSSPNPPWLDEILNDFSALGRAVYLDDPLLGLGHAALDDRDELGIPRFTPQTPRVPVALLERYQALWTHPDTPAAARKPGRPARCSAAWPASPTRRHAAPHADGRTSMITRRLRPAQAGG